MEFLTIALAQTDNKSTKFVSNVTARTARSNINVAEWRAAREWTGRLEVLLDHLKKLGIKNSATALDERLASLRTKRHLAGASAQCEVPQIVNQGCDISEKCWRNVEDVRRVNSGSISN